jgi:hypothetical protein
MKLFMRLKSRHIFLLVILGPIFILMMIIPYSLITGDNKFSYFFVCLYAMLFTTLFLLWLWSIQKCISIGIGSKKSAGNIVYDIFIGVLFIFFFICNNIPNSKSK